MWHVYVGIPYVKASSTRRGVDCYGLVRLLYRDVYGIELTDWEATLPDGAKRPDLISAFEAAVSEETWELVETPQEGDIVVFRLFNSPLHCGMMINPAQFLHSIEPTGSSVERINSPMWKKRIVHYLRYKNGLQRR
jgi:cell wall-associated NlpC family hydrolase